MCGKEWYAYNKAGSMTGMDREETALIMSCKILTDAGKRHNKMFEKEKFVYNGAVTAFNKVTNQKKALSPPQERQNCKSTI